MRERVRACVRFFFGSVGFARTFVLLKIKRFFSFILSNFFFLFLNRSFPSLFPIVPPDKSVMKRKRGKFNEGDDCDDGYDDEFINNNDTNLRYISSWAI